MGFENFGEGRINYEKLPEDIKKEIQEKLEEGEEKRGIPTEEGSVFESEGRIYIVKNGMAVRATQEEIEEYLKQKKEKEENSGIN